MDTRYRDQGYAATFTETSYGAFVTITKKGVPVTDISVGFFGGGSDAKAQIEIKRRAPDEFKAVTTRDDFDESGS